MEEEAKSDILKNYNKDMAEKIQDQFNGMGAGIAVCIGLTADGKVRVIYGDVAPPKVIKQAIKKLLKNF